MILLQEAIAGGMILLYLAFIILAIIVIGLILFFLMTKSNRRTDEKDIRVDITTERNTGKTKPHPLTIIILIAVLIGMIIFGNWLCNFKYD